MTEKDTNKQVDESVATDRSPRSAQSRKKQLQKEKSHNKIW